MEKKNQKNNVEEANVEASEDVKANGEGTVSDGLGIKARRVIAYIVLIFISVSMRSLTGIPNSLKSESTSSRSALKYLCFT